jgi:hypothetical protein
VLIGFLGGVLLHGNSELQESGVGSGFEFAVGTDVNGVGKCGDGGMLLREGWGCEYAEREKSERGFHGMPPK